MTLSLPMLFDCPLSTTRTRKFQPSQHSKASWNDQSRGSNQNQAHQMEHSPSCPVTLVETGYAFQGSSHFWWVPNETRRDLRAPLKDRTFAPKKRSFRFLWRVPYLYSRGCGPKTPHRTITPRRLALKELKECAFKILHVRNIPGKYLL